MYTIFRHNSERKAAELARYDLCSCQRGDLALHLWYQPKVDGSGDGHSAIRWCHPTTQRRDLRWRRRLGWAVVGQTEHRREDRRWLHRGGDRASHQTVRAPTPSNRMGTIGEDHLTTVDEPSGRRIT